jgi:hypothetical protein
MRLSLACLFASLFSFVLMGNCLGQSASIMVPLLTRSADKARSGSKLLDQIRSALRSLYYLTFGVLVLNLLDNPWTRSSICVQGSLSDPNQVTSFSLLSLPCTRKRVQPWPRFGPVPARQPPFWKNISDLAPLGEPPGTSNRRFGFTSRNTRTERHGKPAKAVIKFDKSVLVEALWASGGGLSAKA